MLTAPTPGKELGGALSLLGAHASVRAPVNHAEHFHFLHFLLKVSLLRIFLDQGKQVLT